MRFFVTCISVLCRAERGKRTMLAFLLAAFSLLSLGVVPVHAAIINFTISGMVSLPSGVAPAGGENVEVSVNVDGSIFYENVTIAEGAASAPYTRTLSYDDAGIIPTSVKVGYNCDATKYVGEGYYNSAATDTTIWDRDQATSLTVEDHIDINLTLLAGNTISGTVTLPAAAPPGGMDVDVRFYNGAYNNGSSVYYSNSSPVNIAAGTSSASYAIILPVIANAQWEVSYSYFGAEAYVNQGYYNSTATTWEYYQATLLASGSDYPGINLTILAGNTISGTVSLPSPATVEMYISIYAQGQEGGSGTDTVHLAVGESFGTYQITLPIIANNNFTVSGQYNANNSPYVSSFYYNSTATTWRTDQATMLPGGNHNNINLAMLPAKTINGTVRLPSGTASTDMYIQIGASYKRPGNTCSAYQFSSSYDSDYVTINAGESLATYTLSVPADNSTEWGVSYVPYYNNYLREGYYNSTATTWDKAQATMLTGVANHTGIDLTLLTGRTISGKVSLPVAAPVGGMWVGVEASNENNVLYSVYDWVFIVEGATSETYTLHVPPDPAAKWGVKYWDDEEDALYVQEGYYNSSATTWDPDLATMLPGGEVDYTGKDMTLITGKTISGTITLGAACYNDFWGCNLHAYALNLNHSGMEYGGYTPIANGASSGSYTIVVPDVASAQWQVSGYAEVGSAEKMPSYYYNGTPTSPWDSALATPLSGGADHGSIDMSLPLTYKTISGTVYLPTGKVAPIDLMSVDVFAVTSTGSQVGESGLYFQDGGNYATYSMYVPDVAGAQWLVKYENYQDTCDGDDSKSKTISEGYYNTTTTVGKAQATPLSGSADHENINMTLLKTTLFNWNLFLPTITCPKK